MGEKIRMGFFIFICCFALFFFIAFKAYRNTKEVMINRVEIPIRNKRGNKKNSLHILHISDLHLENLSVTPEEMYNYINGQKIDLIALTGDFLDRKRSIPKLAPYLDVLSSLQPNYGIYSVFGNHDYALKGSQLQMLELTLRRYGCRILKNEHVNIRVNGHLVNIVGIDDYSTKRSDIDAAFSSIQEGLNVILTHDPNIVLEMKNVDFDYLLSGHFHGGQIHWPKPYHLVKMGKLARMNIIKGLHKHEGKLFYISEGLGQTGVNIRLGSRPEITYHHLYF